MRLSEDILHFVWKNGWFETNDLLTTDGHKVELLHKGVHNFNSGPDFKEAKVKIGETVWAGQIEIHVRSGDWYQHQHHLDKAYDNVILHVVYFDDRPVFINGQKLPTIILNGRVKPSLFNKYKRLLQSQYEIACGKNVLKVSEEIRVSQMERALIRRLERKADQIKKELANLENDWEEVTFRILFKCMIGKVNEQPAEWVLNEVPLKLLRAFGDRVFEKEAILLGVSGLLNEPVDEYSSRLKKEYLHQKSKNALSEINPVSWKYGRMRPSQFPATRMAQIAALLSKHHYLFTVLLTYPQKEISNVFSSLSVSDYWKNHYRLGVPSKNSSAQIGQMQNDLILINAVAPVLYAYGTYLSNEKLVNKSIDILLAINPEKNTIIRKWNKYGIKATSAFDSQSLIELYNSFCIPKKCLTCHIGANLMRS